MSTKKISIQFSEQSKAVVADVKIEYEGQDCPTNEAVLEETKALFKQAYNFAQPFSMQKAR